MVKNQYRQRPSGGQQFPHDKLIPLGGEFPVDRADAVAGVVVPEVVILPHTGTTLGGRKDGALLFRDGDSVGLYRNGSHQNRGRSGGLYRQGKQPQTVVHPDPLHPTFQPPAVPVASCSGRTSPGKTSVSDFRKLLVSPDMNSLT